jgi:hypothetical protein
VRFRLANFSSLSIDVLCLLSSEIASYLLLCYENHSCTLAPPCALGHTGHVEHACAARAARILAASHQQQLALRRLQWRAADEVNEGTNSQIFSAYATVQCSVSVLSGVSDGPSARLVPSQLLRSMSTDGEATKGGKKGKKADESKAKKGEDAKASKKAGEDAKAAKKPAEDAKASKKAAEDAKPAKKAEDGKAKAAAKKAEDGKPSKKASEDKAGKKAEEHKVTNPLASTARSALGAPAFLYPKV